MPASSIPVIETKRLILRGPVPEDYPNFKSTFTSYRARFMGGPLNEYEAWMLYAAEIGHWQIRGFGMWMIHDRETDRSLGMAGGWFPAKWPEREIAWVIWPEVAGRGIALEATDAVRRHLYDRMGWTGAVSYLDPRNTQSILLAQRLGAKRDAEARSVDGHDIVYRHPAPERLRGSQIEDAIQQEIASFEGPIFSSAKEASA